MNGTRSVPTTIMLNCPSLCFLQLQLYLQLLMESSAREFLVRLLSTPSPSGFERPIQDVVREYVRPFADEVRTDLHGNVIAAKNPNSKLRVMFAGHCTRSACWSRTSIAKD